MQLDIDLETLASNLEKAGEPDAARVLRLVADLRRREQRTPGSGRLAALAASLTQYVEQLAREV